MIMNKGWGKITKRFYGKNEGYLEPLCYIKNEALFMDTESEFTPNNRVFIPDPKLSEEYNVGDLVEFEYHDQETDNPSHDHKICTNLQLFQKMPLLNDSDGDAGCIAYYKEIGKVIYGPIVRDEPDEPVCFWKRDDFKDIVYVVGDKTYVMINPKPGLSFSDMIRWLKRLYRSQPSKIPEKYLEKLEKITPGEHDTHKLYKEVLSAKISTIRLGNDILKDLEKSIEESTYLAKFIRRLFDEHRKEIDLQVETEVRNMYQPTVDILKSEKIKIETEINELRKEEKQLQAHKEYLTNSLYKYQKEYGDYQKLISIISAQNYIAHINHFKPNKSNLMDDFQYSEINLPLKRILLVNSINTAISLAKAFGEHKRLILHTNPKWLEFKQLWDSGLNILWESARIEPKTLHILIIENINLTLPECWFSPLLNLYNDFSSHIPFSNYDGKWPDNFIVISTKVGANDLGDEYGLPISTFFYDNATIIKQDLEYYNSMVDFRKAFNGY